MVATFDKFTPAYDVMHDLGYDLYVSPFTRVLPYLVGVGAGYMLFNTNGEMPFQEVRSFDHPSFDIIESNLIPFSPLLPFSCRKQ